MTFFVFTTMPKSNAHPIPNETNTNTIKLIKICSVLLGHEIVCFYIEIEGIKIDFDELELNGSLEGKTLILSGFPKTLNSRSFKLATAEPLLLKDGSIHGYLIEGNYKINQGSVLIDFEAKK